MQLGLHEFFENPNQSIPPVQSDSPSAKAGRAWMAMELRQKSFDDLHKLWYVLLKERNLLATQLAESKRLRQRWFGWDRQAKVRLSMARIKGVLSERAAMHEQACKLMAAKEGKAPVGSDQAGAIQVALDKSARLRLIEGRRRFRKRINYRQKRHPLFT